MNNKQVKRLRRLGLDTKRAKRGFNTLQHDQKKEVLESVASMQMMEQLQANFDKLQASATAAETSEVTA